MERLIYGTSDKTWKDFLGNLTLKTHCLSLQGTFLDLDDTRLNSLHYHCRRCSHLNAVHHQVATINGSLSFASTRENYKNCPLAPSLFLFLYQQILLQFPANSLPKSIYFFRWSVFTILIQLKF